MRAQVLWASGLFSHLSLVLDWSQATEEVIGSWTSRCDIFMEVAFGHMGGNSPSGIVSVSTTLWCCMVRLMRKNNRPCLHDLI